MELMLFPLVLNIALLLATADRHRLTIFTEKDQDQDRKLDIHLYNNILYQPYDSLLDLGILNL